MANATILDESFINAVNASCVLGIDAICSRTPDELFEMSRLVWLSILTFGVLVLLSGHVLHSHHFHGIPESLVTVLWGSCMGLLWYYRPIIDKRDYLDADFVRLMMSFMLNFVALPIIIFESGWSLRTRDFVSQLGYIMLFAIVGTIICVIAVAALIKLTPDWCGVMSWRLALTYAALISSTDPVATLATFSQLNVDPMLFILVFGESQINDAVAITLFRSLNDRDLDGIIPLFSRMAVVLCGSVTLGVVTAMIYLLMLRCFRMGRTPAQAILLIFVSPFLTFSLAESCQFSGIIAVLFNSILMGVFSGYHLPLDAMLLCNFLLKQASTLADNAIFLLSGVVAVFIVSSHGEGVKFGVCLGLFCIVGRFLAIMPMGALSNVVKYMVSRELPKEREHMITVPHMAMMWHSGLRGGISLMLALELGEWVEDDGGAGTKEKLVNGTIVLVMLYLLLFASTTSTALRLLGIPFGTMVRQGTRLYEKSDKQGIAWRSMKKIRKHVMLPILVGKRAAAMRARSVRGASGGAGGAESVGLSSSMRSAGEKDLEVADLDSACPTSYLDSRSTMIDLFGTANPRQDYRECVDVEDDEDSSEEESDSTEGPS